MGNNEVFEAFSENIFERDGGPDSRWRGDGVIFQALSQTTREERGLGVQRVCCTPAEMVMGHSLTKVEKRGMLQWR